MFVDPVSEIVGGVDAASLVNYSSPSIYYKRLWESANAYSHYFLGTDLCHQQICQDLSIIILLRNHRIISEENWE